MKSVLSFTLLKCSFFFLTLIPLIVLIFDVTVSNLGANPVQALMQRSGFLSLNFLVLAVFLLAISHSEFVWHFAEVLQFASLLYATAHCAVFVVFEQDMDVNFIIESVNLNLGHAVAIFAILIWTAITFFTKIYYRSAAGKQFSLLYKTLFIVVVLILLHVMTVSNDHQAVATYGVITGCIYGCSLFKRFVSK